MIRFPELPIAADSRILLLLDFDGTLAPIVSYPECAAMSARSRKVLEELLKHSNIHIAIVSGRMLEDVRLRVGLPVIYSGNHGLEIEGPAFKFQRPVLQQARVALASIVAELVPKLRDVEGALIEDKALTVSIHTRMVQDSNLPLVERLVREAVMPYLNCVWIRPGKKVWEIRPQIEWDKGRAACWIRDRIGGDRLLTICMGDDLTDEDMFRALPEALSIKVGPGSTAAKFRLAGPAEVTEFLEHVLASVRCGQ